MLKNILFIIAGILSLSLGVIGSIIPVLPTTPFLVLASFFFIKGSPKIQKWFEATAFYKKHLITLKEKKGLTLKTKLRILVPFYLIMIYCILLSNTLTMKMIFLTLVLIKTAVFIKIRTISRGEARIREEAIPVKADQSP